MRTLYLSFLCMILFVLFFYNKTNAQNALPIYDTMITDFGDFNATDLFDGDMETFWFADWNSDNYPARAYLDFGDSIDISKIDLFDISGNGDFKIFTGTPNNWDTIPLIADPLTNYLKWNEYAVQEKTRYLLFQMDTKESRVGEILIYGESSGNPTPMLSPTTNVDVLLGDSASIYIAATNTDQLTATNLPSFVAFTDHGNGEGTFNIRPDSSDLGAYLIHILATGSGGTAQDSFFIHIKNPPQPMAAEVLLGIQQVELVAGAGDPNFLFDEQFLAGDPTNGPGGAPTTSWMPGWAASDYPSIALVDLGEEFLLTRIFLRDINGEGTFKIYQANSPDEWNPEPLVADGMGGYFAWNEHPMDISTRYLQMEMTAPSALVAEVLVYGIDENFIDSLPPAPIQDLVVNTSNSHSITLGWTAPGDDDSTGIATFYDLRYSSEPITEQNFGTAAPYSIFEPEPAGTLHSVKVSGLYCDSTFYFALRSFDDFNNASPISNVVSGSTAECPPEDISITIFFDSIPSEMPEVHPARLHYNKDFAYSLTFDDASPWEYNNVFPILNGGTSYNGTFESGFFYTDGCGNEIPFTGALSLNGWHILDEYSEFFMSWEQVLEMFSADWDILNHSYTHCAFSCDNYDEEVINNTSMIENKIGFTPTHFAVPSGDEQGYRDPAFDNGMVALHDQHWTLPGRGGLKVDEPLDFFQFELHRNTLEIEIPPYGEDIDKVANLSIGQHYWFSEYAHRVGNPDEPYVTIATDDFRAYMAYIEDTYGKDGEDRIWFAPLQEVYEYILVRDQIIPVGSEFSNNQLTVTYSLANIPNNLRRYALSLIVDLGDNLKINNVTVDGADATFNEAGLINLKW